MADGMKEPPKGFRHVQGWVCGWMCSVASARHREDERDCPWSLSAFLSSFSLSLPPRCPVSSQAQSWPPWPPYLIRATAPDTTPPAHYSKEDDTVGYWSKCKAASTTFCNLNFCFSQAFLVKLISSKLFLSKLGKHRWTFNWVSQFLPQIAIGCWFKLSEKDIWNYFFVWTTTIMAHCLEYRLDPEGIIR